MRVRPVLLTGLAAGALLAPFAAASTPQITDPSGDALGGQAAHDILSVTWETTGADATRQLVATIELAGAPSVTPGTSYVVTADTPCGPFHMLVRWGVVVPGGAPKIGAVTSGSYYYCGGPGDMNSTPGAGTFPVQYSISGNTLSFSTSVAGLPAVMDGGTFTGLEAHTAPADPVVDGSGAFLGASFDSASGGSATFQITNP